MLPGQQKAAKRREMAIAETERMMRRYPRECGEVVTRRLSPEDVDAILHRGKDINDCVEIKE